MNQTVIIQAYCNNCLGETQRAELSLDEMLSDAFDRREGRELPFSVAECGHCGRNPCQHIRVRIEEEVSDG
tara:strand:- start:4442 stop:4654 length:213 start_codon:yes stop_codon:yes gene_type:complete